MFPVGDCMNCIFVIYKIFIQAVLSYLLSGRYNLTFISPPPSLLPRLLHASGSIRCTPSWLWVASRPTMHCSRCTRPVESTPSSASQWLSSRPPSATTSLAVTSAWDVIPPSMRLSRRVFFFISKNCVAECVCCRRGKFRWGSDFFFNLEKVEIISVKIQQKIWNWDWLIQI